MHTILQNVRSYILTHQLRFKIWRRLNYLKARTKELAKMQEEYEDFWLRWEHMKPGKAKESLRQQLRNNSLRIIRLQSDVSQLHTVLSIYHDALGSNVADRSVNNLPCICTSDTLLVECCGKEMNKPSENSHEPHLDQ